tara:strand:- start:116 stop:661 length:546 start_codon:yes stop_codon:yes gene_type:complete
MCDPVTIAITRTALTIYQARESAKAEREQAIRQNQIAENARIQKENAENLRIRQVAIRKKDKAFDLNIESKEKQATARAAAENVGGAALDRVVNNYLRLEGKFTSQILANLEQEIANSNQNKKLFAMEQEGRQSYIPEVDTAGIFAASAIEFGGDYLEWKTRKEEKDLKQKEVDIMIKEFG